MTAYTLNLPEQLKQEVEQLAQSQSISLDQFILLAVSEKVSSLKDSFSQITSRQGASGQFESVVKGTSLRVQTLIIANQKWGMSHAQIADEYNLSEVQVKEALAFYEVHKDLIDTAMTAEQSLEAANG
ncbi:DUF433 domain-containing protein [Tumidithrix helvetica PCC 7403]|uniref:DUF433 domain-containing protein n=1 Tax=Tumidithrix helvetica TaxID=3457545 RepID=UPI003CA9F9F4